jgi:O-succinylbenzoic acid--CoA ligase
VRELVAFDLPPGARFLDELERTLDAGDAIWPVDQRLPASARARLFDAIAPSVVLTTEGRRRVPGGVPVEAGDALVVATSGTTGAPKGVVLTLDAVLASARATTTRLGVDPGVDRWCSCLPLSHVGGLSVLTRALFTKTPVEVLPGFSPDALEGAARRGATLTSLVPTTYRRLRRPEAFRRILLGGAAPPSMTGENVVVTYGLTETGSGVVYDGLPLDGVEIALGPEGVIALRGLMLLRAYRDGTCPLDPGGWLVTGDVGRIEESGRLVVLGRADECIVTGGENVWPDAVEAVIRTIPGCDEVAVAGVADPEWGERVVAFVVGSAVTPTLDEVRAVVRDELGAPAAPKEVVVVDTLPRTPSGKVRRAALRALAETR